MNESGTSFSVVMVLALLVLSYTYVGYPALLVVLQRLSPLKTRRDPDWQPNVSVCIAAYNAESTIEAKLASVVALDYPADKLEVIVYSDGSTDQTNRLVTAWGARNSRVRLLVGAQRMGKPTALNQMAAAADGEVLLLTDSRQPILPGSLRAMLAALADPLVGCVTGNLKLVGGEASGVYWRYENWIRQTEARFRSVVGMTGPLSILRRRDLPPLPDNVILDDVWIPMRLRLQGRRILFCEEAVALDQAFADDREFARKVRTLAGNYQLLAMMPSLLVPFVNPSWFETWSHKIMRLACPWALAVLLGTSILAVASGGPMWTTGLLLAQIAFYLAALAGRRLGPLGRVARTFVVLNVAAVVGLWRYLIGAQKVTW